MFQQPREAGTSDGDRFTVSDNVGALVLIYVHEIRDGIETPYGPKQAVSCDVHALDGSHGGEVFKDQLIFQGALIGSLKAAAAGDPVLGRIGQGTAKPGQSAPYILIPYTDADAAVATGYIQRMKPGFQPPPAATPAPAGQVDLSKLPPEVRALIEQHSAA